VQQPLSQEDVRAVLAAAADVLFADGVLPEFLDQWAEETCFLLRAAEESTAAVQRRLGNRPSQPR
jgi:hypothetical protein